MVEIFCFSLIGGRWPGTWSRMPSSDSSAPLPQGRLCVAVDVESFARHTRQEQVDVQNRLLWTMTQACRAAGVDPARCDRQDSGDGQILILPAVVDEHAALGRVVLGLESALYQVNHPAGPGPHPASRVTGAMPGRGGCRQLCCAGCREGPPVAMPQAAGYERAGMRPCASWARL
jgi:hypothetical protein